MLAVPIHVGGGYGGDPDWGHGHGRAPKFAERLTYDLADPAVVGRVLFGCVDRVGRAVWNVEGKEPRAGASSSTASSAGTTPPASPTGSPTHRTWRTPQRSRTTRNAMTLDRDTSSSTAAGRRPPRGDTIEVVAPHTEQVVATCPRAARPTSTPRSPPPARAFDSGPWPRMTPGRADRRRPGVLGPVRRQAWREMAG